MSLERLVFRSMAVFFQLEVFFLFEFIEAVQLNVQIFLPYEIKIMPFLSIRYYAIILAISRVQRSICGEKLAHKARSNGGF